MPKKINKKVIEEKINSLPEPEQEEFESEGDDKSEEEIKPIVKPKKVLSQKQQEHLIKMREKALEAKKNKRN